MNANTTRLRWCACGRFSSTTRLKVTAVKQLAKKTMPWDQNKSIIAVESKSLSEQQQKKIKMTRHVMCLSMSKRYLQKKLVTSGADLRPMLPKYNHFDLAYVSHHETNMTTLHHLLALQTRGHSTQGRKCDVRPKPQTLPSRIYRISSTSLLGNIIQTVSQVCLHSWSTSMWREREIENNNSAKQKWIIIAASRLHDVFSLRIYPLSAGFSEKKLFEGDWALRRYNIAQRASCWVIFSIFPDQFQSIHSA